MPEPALGPDPAPDSGPDSGPGTRTGRQRLTHSLLKPTRGQVVVAVLLAVVGFAMVTQIRSNEVDRSYAGYREQDLIDVLDGLAGTSARAQSEIDRLEQAREDLRSSRSARDAALEEARTEADNLDILAGLVPVTGPGIRITIEETNGAVDIDAMLDTVQELRTAGAEAMQINGEVRVVAQTGFEDGVGGIVVHGVELSPPYVIDVIGEPGTLIGALPFPQGPIDQLEADGATVTYDEQQSLDIESVVEPTRSEFAQPDPGQ